MFKTCLILIVFFSISFFGQTPPCDNPESKAFDWQIGTWQSEDGKQTHEIKKIIDGCIIQEIWKTEGKETAVGLKSFDNGNHNQTGEKKWFYSWTAKGFHQLWEGRKEDGNWRFYRNWFSSGEAILSRTFWTQISADKLERIVEQSRDEGKTWKPWVKDAFIRQTNQQTVKRNVLNNSIISDKFPEIAVKIDKKFKYIGKFDFTIRDIAKGERFVFVDAEESKIKRLFIAQFEEILPTSEEIYRYNFDKALLFGKHKFRQNTFAFSNLEASNENPNGEAALTEKFLKEKGYLLEDELMMSRFVTVPDEEKKHELILFYIENVSQTKHKLSEFYQGDDETKIWKQISGKLTKRSFKAFRIE